MLSSALFEDAEAAALFSDQVALADLLLVEMELARVQGALGMIPVDAAEWLARVLPSLAIAPADLAAATLRNGVVVPGLLAAIKSQAVPSEHLDYLHFGATSQDVIDTALALRLKRMAALWQVRLSGLVAALQALAKTQAETTMAARTYGQVAVPTTFGAVVASWGWPLLTLLRDLPDVQGRVCRVSLSGAAGTSAVFGNKAGELRAALAKALKLSDPGDSWHTDRDGIIGLGGWAGRLAFALGKMGEDLLTLSRSEIGEVRLATSGGSSTMPQKSNPVAPSVLVALCRQAGVLAGGMLAAAPPRDQRDGAAWFQEQIALPDLCLMISRALALAGEIMPGVIPDAESMARNLRSAAYAEALTFARAAVVGRSAAEGEVKAALVAGEDVLARAARLGIDVGELRQRALGQAPHEARTFAEARP